MKTRNLTKWSFTIIAAFTLSFYAEHIYGTYQRADSTEFSSKSTTLRLFHARELLGKAYAGSLPEKSASLSSVAQFVEGTFKDKFDSRWKKHVTKTTATLLAESDKKGFDPLFVLAVIQTESQFNPVIVGGHGEIGLMQIKPDTAKWISQKEGLKWRGAKSLKDPATNVRIGIAYLSFLRKNFAGTVPHYVAAYNMGPANVRRLTAQSKEPREYPTKVMSNYQLLYSQLLRTEYIAQL